MNLYGSKQLADSMRTVRQNTIVIAEDIPEESYSYRPTPGSRSVRETFLHILVGAQAAQRIHGEQRIASFENLNFQALLDGLPVKEKDQRSKEEIVALLRSEGDRWCRWVEQIPESVLSEPVKMPASSDPATKNRFELLLGTKEHEMHHRAQLMVIERLLGIVPHLTRKRQPVRETAVR
jgi:uncharacterized damage-inducible protein DinB